MATTLDPLTAQDVAKIDNTDPVRNEFQLGARVQGLRSDVTTLEAASGGGGHPAEIYVDFEDGSDANDGSPSSPVLTVQAAIDIAEALTFAGKGAATINLFGIAAGSEALTVAFDGIMTMVAHGRAWNVTSLTWNPPASNGSELHLTTNGKRGENWGWSVGTLTIAGAIPAATAYLSLTGARVTGNIVATGLTSGTVRAEFRSSYVGGTVTDGGSNGLQCRAWDSRFNGNVDVHKFDSADRVRFSGNLEINSAPSGTPQITPYGFRDCELEGNFTGPDGTATWDQHTAQSFIDNGGTWAGTSDAEDFIEAVTIHYSARKIDTLPITVSDADGETINTQYDHHTFNVQSRLLVAGARVEGQHAGKIPTNAGTIAWDGRFFLGGQQIHGFYNENLSVSTVDWMMVTKCWLFATGYPSATAPGMFHGNAEYGLDSPTRDIEGVIPGSFDLSADTTPFQMTCEWNGVEPGNSVTLEHAELQIHINP